MYAMYTSCSKRNSANSCHCADFCDNINCSLVKSLSTTFCFQSKEWTFMDHEVSLLLVAAIVAMSFYGTRKQKVLFSYLKETWQEWWGLNYEYHIECPYYFSSPLLQYSVYQAVYTLEDVSFRDDTGNIFSCKYTVRSGDVIYFVKLHIYFKRVNKKISRENVTCQFA